MSSCKLGRNAEFQAIMPVRGKTLNCMKSILWYGVGRTWIEGLRSDSLYLFDWTLMGEPIRVSQALSVVMVVVSLAALIYMRGIRKCTADGLMVHQLAAEKAAEKVAAEAEAQEIAEAEATAAIQNDTDAEQVEENHGDSY